MTRTEDREKMYLDKLLEQEREIAYMRYKLEEKERLLNKCRAAKEVYLSQKGDLSRLLERARKFIPPTEHAKLREEIKIALGIH